MNHEKPHELVRGAPAEGAPSAPAPPAEPRAEAAGRAAGPEEAPRHATLEDVKTWVARLQALAKRGQSLLGGLRERYDNARAWLDKGVGKLLPTSLKSVETGLVTLRNILGNFAVLLLALAMLVLVWREMTSKAIRIQTLRVEDAALIEKGLTGQALAVKLLEQMNEIERKAWTSMERRDIAVGEEEKLPDIEIPGTGLRFADIVAFARAFAGGGAPRITGEALAVGDQRDQLQITILTSGRQAMTARKSLEEVDALLREAAEHVYRNNRPVLYAFYLDATSRQEPSQKDELRLEALEVLEQAVAGKLSDEERARIYNLWGVILTDQGSFKEAIEKFDLALEKKWYEWLLGSDRGWYAELMKARALSDWNRHSDAIMQIEGFIADHPDMDEKGDEALSFAYHNWGVWYVENCPGSSAECEPAAKYRQGVNNARSRVHVAIGDGFYGGDLDVESALQHARRAEQLAVDESERKGACGLLLDVIVEPEVAEERTDADDARKRCEQILGASN